MCAVRAGRPVHLISLGLSVGWNVSVWSIVRGLSGDHDKEDGGRRLGNNAREGELR